jgi:diaminopimelate decarboxylase
VGGLAYCNIGGDVLLDHLAQGGGSQRVDNAKKLVHGFEERGNAQVSIRVRVGVSKSDHNFIKVVERARRFGGNGHGGRRVTRGGGDVCHGVWGDK